MAHSQQRHVLNKNKGEGQVLGRREEQLRQTRECSGRNILEAYSGLVSVPGDGCVAV